MGCMQSMKDWVDGINSTFTIIPFHSPDGISYNISFPYIRVRERDTTKQVVDTNKPGSLIRLVLR